MVTKSATATLLAKIDAKYNRTDEIATATDSVTLSKSLESFGAEGLPFNVVYRETFSLSQSEGVGVSTSTYVDSFGATREVATAFGILIVSKATEPGSVLRIRADGSFLTSSSDDAALLLGPGGSLLIANPVDGWNIASEIVLESTSGDYDVDVVILGNAA
jgi:hypothetical protein